MEQSAEIVASAPAIQQRLQRGESSATGIWLWGQGRRPALEDFSRALESAVQ